MQTVDANAVAYGRTNGVAVKPGTAFGELNAIDGYAPTKDDMDDFARHQAQFIGQFLVDRDGVVRWVNIERSPGEFPSEAALLASARAGGK